MMDYSTGTFVARTMTDDSSLERIIDVDLALTFTAGDREMLISISEVFLQEAPLQLQAVGSAVEQGDAVQAGKAAHTLKGSVNIFGAAAAAAAAGRVEGAAEAGRLAADPFGLAEFKSTDGTLVLRGRETLSRLMLVETPAADFPATHGEPKKIARPK